MVNVSARRACRREDEAGTSRSVDSTRGAGQVVPGTLPSRSTWSFDTWSDDLLMSSAIPPNVASLADAIAVGVMGEPADGVTDALGVTVGGAVASGSDVGETRVTESTAVGVARLMAALVDISCAGRVHAWGGDAGEESAGSGVEASACGVAWYHEFPHMQMRPAAINTRTARSTGWATLHPSWSHLAAVNL